MGIRENAHIAFYDPPADFQTNAIFIRVSLNQKCPEQQVGEGWFNRLADVTFEAITMNMKQRRKSKSIIFKVLEYRKATAVREAIEGPLQSLSGISPQKTSKHSLFF